MSDDKNNKEDIDLSGALKDASTSQNRYRAIKYYHEFNSPKIIQWTMNLSGGLVKNEKQAGYILLGFVAIAIIVALFLILSGSTNEVKSPKPDIINQPQPEEGFIPR